MVLYMQPILGIHKKSDSCHFGLMNDSDPEKPNRIAEIRKAKGLQQHELADKIGTSQIQISRLERGERTLRPHWAKLIANALGTTPQAIYGFDESEPAAEQDSEPLAIDRHNGAGLTKDLPIRGEPSGLSEGVILKPDGNDISGYTYRYPDAGPGAFAVEVNGKTMYPRFWNRELAICVPSRKPAIDDYVMVIDRRGMAVVRLLSAISRESITVETHNPPESHTIPVEDIEAIYPLMSWGR